MNVRSSYSDDEMLSLSGIQHFMFCPRQWALIHIEQLWAENLLTMEGALLHENVDNPFMRETNGSDVITLRGVRLVSSRLGLTGIADAVELHPYPGVDCSKKELLRSRQFTALPVEYKRGRRKVNDCDRMQLVAQAMILEEILGIDISEGAIFYWEERHREYLDISDALRADVEDIVGRMHDIALSGVTPPGKKTPACRSCSLADLCIPSICGKNVKHYLLSRFDEEDS